MSSPATIDADFSVVVDALGGGEVIPFLGAGVNFVDRPPDTPWKIGRYAPSGGELARYLSTQFGVPPEIGDDLLRVSQYAAVMRGTGPLYKRLHAVFSPQYPITRLHRFIAEVPARLRNAGLVPMDLVITTNYDDVLERAFAAAGEPFDLVVYLAQGSGRGRFMHIPDQGEPRLIERPNEYLELPMGERTVILKIHGAVAREAPDDCSFVITEDDYIDYLARMDINNPLPKILSAKMRQSGFLFLGYSMRDWNLRVILYRIWGEQRLTYRSWAVQRDPPEVDRKFWSQHGVDILQYELSAYIETLNRLLVGASEAPG